MNNAIDEVPPMRLTSIAPWFGGKRTLAPDIIAELGPHKQYFEPFCGSMAVLLHKPQTAKETVNDLHGGLICLAHVLACELQSECLYTRLQRTLFCETLLDDAQSFLEACPEPPWRLRNAELGEQPKFFRADANMLEYAYWYFVASWMARNGTAGTERLIYQPAVRWGMGGGSPTIRWRSAIESIPAWHQRLMNVVILRRDAFSIIPKFEDEPHTAIYCDPPYHATSRSGIAEYSSRYLHDFKTRGAKVAKELFGDDSFGATASGPDDHQRLAEQLREFKRARIVVSYYDCPEVRDLYPGWTIVKKTMQKTLLNQNKGSDGRNQAAPEILLINGPSLA